MFKQQHNLGRRFGASKMHLSPMVAYAAVRSKAVVLLLLVYCFMYPPLPLFVGVLCCSLLWCALLYVLSSYAIRLTRKREMAMVALLLLFFVCLVTVKVL